MRTGVRLGVDPGDARIGVASSDPSAEERNSVTGAASTRDQVSTRIFRSGEKLAVWLRSPGVRVTRPVPSKWIR